MSENPRGWRLVDRPKWKVQLQWEPRDWWVGLFWRRTEVALHFYICLLPLVPLHITILWLDKMAKANVARLQAMLKELNAEKENAEKKR